MNLTIIIPAYNEEAYLPPTLDAIHASVAHLQTDTDVDVEIVVVDNNSVDGTAEVARRYGATVVAETTLFEIYSVMSDPACVGGGVDVDCRPKRRAMRFDLRIWRALGRLTDMVQGVTQFFRKSVFEEIG